MDRFYVTAIKCIYEHYLQAILTAFLVIQAVLEQYSVERSRESLLGDLSPSLVKLWNEIEQLHISKHFNVAVGAGDMVAKLLQEKGVIAAVEALVETYLRKSGK